MTENPLPTTRRTWRTWRTWLPRRLPSGRKALAAGAVVAGLAIGGAGFGAGYAVGDSDPTDTATTQTTGEWSERGMPGDGRGPMGEVGGQMGGPPGGLSQREDGAGGGTTGETPDFDGDGVPDSDSGSASGSGSTSDSATQNS